MYLCLFTVYFALQNKKSFEVDGMPLLPGI